MLLTGITYEKARGKWRARAGTGEYRYHVGRYDTEEEAAAALRAEMPVVKKRRVCGEADANATASKTSTVNGALATLPLLRGCARRVDGPAADRHHVRESPGEVAGAGRYR